MTEPASGRRGLWHSVRHYFEKEALAAFFVGVSSGFPYAMIAATLTTRLAQDGIRKSTVTTFSLALLAYNLKFLWAWVLDSLRLPLIGRLGQRVSWMLFSGVLVIAAVTNLALADPRADLRHMAIAAILVAVAGATYDIVIDAYRIETLKPEQLGTGSGMSQYGWRIGSAGAAGLALVVAGRIGWHAAYLATLLFALPAMITALALGEPVRHVVHHPRRGLAELWASVAGPFIEFFSRHGAWLVLLFILLHKIGDTLAQLTVRLLFNDLHFTNGEIATWDVGLGFWAYLAGIFVGGALYEKLGLKHSVMLALLLMGVSNLGFALLAAAGHSNVGLAAAIGFENTASGYGGVVVVAYLSALANLEFTAAQYAMVSAAASVVGRMLTGRIAGQMIEAMGFVNFYLVTVLAALPGILVFWYMMRVGLVDQALGDAATRRGGKAGRR
ncbi:MAG TPA: MFS transporter [Steroidobacteraceae bacterium]|nr:MFS transporter [Steroidobacteraceae bacterium]